MRTVALGDHVEILSGFAFKSERFNNDGRGLPLVRIRDVTPATSRTYYDGEYDSRFVLSDGDLLVGMDGEFNCARWAGGNALLNQRVCRVRAVSKFLDEQYLFWFLPKALKDIEQKSNFVTVKHLSAKQINEIEIPLPPLEEQKRIAAILDQANELRRKRQRALDRLNQLGQAIFIEMFGDPTTNPKAWPTAKASELADRITVGLVVRPASYYCESGVPAIRGTNIKESGIDLSDVVYFSKQDNDTALAKSRIWSNDIVIVRSGRPGLAAIVPPELHGANAIDVLIFTPNREKVAPQFIRDLVNSEGGKRLVLSESRGQVQQHFNVGSLSEAEFFVPPFNLQLEYQRRIEALQDQATRFKSAALASDGLFSSLQDRAFRGELTASRLKEAAA